MEYKKLADKWLNRSFIALSLYLVFNILMYIFISNIDYKIGDIIIVILLFGLIGVIGVPLAISSYYNDLNETNCAIECNQCAYYNENHNECIK